MGPYPFLLAHAASSAPISPYRPLSALSTPIGPYRPLSAPIGPIGPIGPYRPYRPLSSQLAMALAIASLGLHGIANRNTGGCHTPIRGIGPVRPKQAHSISSESQRPELCIVRRSLSGQDTRLSPQPPGFQPTSGSWLFASCAAALAGAPNSLCFLCKL